MPPKQFIRGEWFVGIALLTGLVWILVYWAGAGTWWAAGIAFVVGFTFRLLALYRGWEEPLAKEPKGVYQHSDGRPCSAASSRASRSASCTTRSGRGGRPRATRVPRDPQAKEMTVSHDRGGHY